jgi:biopolymer transport protein ExbB/TolQ
VIQLAAIEDVLFDIADALRTPVLIAALIAGAISLLELGGLVVELLKRRRRRFATLEQASEKAALSLFADKDPQKARAWMRQAAWSAQMAHSLDFIVDRAAVPGSNPAIAKALADFDFSSLRRLERTRLLVRFGPALGLMGTLIPLSPALAGLANGDVDKLASNLRVAFSVTVIGLLIGAIGFAISLVRDRLYGQDHSDLEYAANALTAGRFGSASKETAEAVRKAPAGTKGTPAQAAAAPASAQTTAATVGAKATAGTSQPQAAPGAAKPQTTSQPGVTKSQPTTAQPAAPSGQPSPQPAAPAAPEQASGEKSGKKRRFKLFVPAPSRSAPAPEPKTDEPKTDEIKKPEQG